MYPVLFWLGTFEVTSFGALVGVAAIVGAWLFGRELNRSRLPGDAMDARMRWRRAHAADEVVLGRYLVLVGVVAALPRARRSHQ